MKKFLMLAAVVALVAAALALPAVAQVNFDDCFPFCDDNGDEARFFDFFNEPVINQEIGQESQSGDVAMGFSVNSSGDYAMQCVAPLQFGNTGNLQNAQGFLQYGSSADDVEFGGSSFVFAPSVQTQCDQAVQQSAAASSSYYGY